ncbi:putative D-aminoacylase [Hypoxylon sp. FL1150]|nr:putative D-aminoacylase [Hypoxylon sp. FL1150]
MSPLDEFLAEATTAGPGPRRIPGCVLVAYKDGVLHDKSFGTKTLDPKSPHFGEPLSMDSTMWIASLTKLMTAISVLQCVEKGLLNLDDDISTVLPEWKERELLLRFDEATGAPLLQKTEGKLSLRMLLTHSSGLCYPVLEPDFKRYLNYRTEQGWVMELMDLCPNEPVALLFEPGTDWKYGFGTDWAGKMVERATGLRLNDYMDRHIWQPLGMTSTSFRLSSRPDIRARQAELAVRSAADGGSLAPFPTPYFPEATRDDHGGAGTYSCARDYVKVLVACATSDPRLLTAAGYDALCAPGLSEAAAARFRDVQGAVYAAGDAAAPELTGAPPAIPAPARESLSWAPGGMVVTQDAPGGRRAGSISWGGLPNLSWVVDRKSRTALLYASQLLPPGDVLTRLVVRWFEREVYDGEFFSKGASG